MAYFPTTDGGVSDFGSDEELTNSENQYPTGISSGVGYNVAGNSSTYEEQQIGFAVSLYLQLAMWLTPLIAALWIGC